MQKSTLKDYTIKKAPDRKPISMSSSTPDKNQLDQETSPYLLQHKDNPVHWWPWGPEALEAAKTQNKPILISIGYAACHWCHVMAHESFEDEQTAQLMNEKFINIKVDREERPDIDAIYMAALHHLGEQGGWPLTMFLTPDAKPYWGGTYFPPIQSFGRPSFAQALEYAEKIYRDDNEAVMHNATSLTQLIAPQKPKMMGPEISDDILRNVTQRMGEMMDGHNGGLRGAPKFPQYPLFNFLWRVGLRFDQQQTQTNVEHLLQSVFQGGIYDHIGGGLARYAVDEQWLVPHFEKMLYDNALMVELATQVYKQTKTPLLKIRIEEIINWAEREMLLKEGAFAASLDADSEGEEGKFYVWQAQEIKSLLGENYEFFAKHYDVSDQGNWEGKTIPNRLQSPELLSNEDEQKLNTLKTTLLEARNKRTRPGLDDKILTDWNGMMIAALTQASDTFNQPKWQELAKTAYHFIIDHMITKDEGLHHSYCAGKCTSPALIQDFAHLIRASLTLYQSTNDKTYLQKALSLLQTANEDFWCPDYGAYFTTSKHRQDVIIRGKTGADEATPNANAIMVSNLMTLYCLTGDETLREKAQKTVQAFGAAIAKNIFSHIGLLASAIDIMDPLHLIIIKAKDDQQTAQDMQDLAKTVSAPNLIVQLIDETETIPASSPAHGKTTLENKSTAYLCTGQHCLAPITNSLTLISAIGENMKVKA